MMPHFFLILLFVSAPALAEMFQAPVTNTQWQVESSPLSCSLIQTIPRFGSAGFSKINGENLTVSFATVKQAAAEGKVTFSLSAAPWQNVDEYELINTQPTSKGQRHFSIEGTLAQQVLAQMQEGRFALIDYTSLNYRQDVTVKLSTIKFIDSLTEFDTCVAQLYPDSFEDMSRLSIYFESEKANLDQKSKDALKRLADYLKIDKSVREIVITGHTDNFGRKSFNTPLSDARTQIISNYLISLEVPEELITLRSYIDHQPVTTNKTAKGRAQNRRTEVLLVR